MLVKILLMLSQGEVTAKSGLALRLGIDESMLAGMIGFLVGQGYLESRKESRSNCDCVSCDGCCKPALPKKRAGMQTWRLTAKGLAAGKSRQLLGN